MPTPTRIIVQGLQITENLEHHKLSDVRRILEDRGCEAITGDNSDDTLRFASPGGTPDNAAATTIEFDEAGFVKPESVKYTAE